MGAAVAVNNIVSNDESLTEDFGYSFFNRLFEKAIRWLLEVTTGGIQAYVSGSTVTSNGGGVAVEAQSDAKIFSVTAGGAGAASGALGGSVVYNRINQQVQAAVKSGATVEAADTMQIKATETSEIWTGAGAVAGSKSTAVGAAVVVNSFANSVKAYIDSSEVTSSGGEIGVSATSSPTITTYSGGGVGAGSYALGGSVSFNVIGNTTEAHISGNAPVTAADAVQVKASETAKVFTVAGELVGAKTFAFGAAVVVNTFANGVKAYINGPGVTSSGGDIEISATSIWTDETYSFGVGVGVVGGAVGGSAPVNDIRNTIDAHISGGATVTASGAVKIIASEVVTIDTIAGGGAGAYYGSLGAAVVVNNLASTVKAFIDGSEVTSLNGEIHVSANPTFATSKHRLEMVKEFNPSAAVSIEEKTITFSAAHGFETGQAVEYDSGGGGAIGGLVHGASYFIIKKSDIVVQLAATFEKATKHPCGSRSRNRRQSDSAQSYFHGRWHHTPLEGGQGFRPVCSGELDGEQYCLQRSARISNGAGRGVSQSRRQAHRRVG